LPKGEMKPRVITSRDNQLLKTIRFAAGESRRISPDLVVAEGLRTVETAMGAGWPIEAAVYSEEFGAADREMMLLEKLADKAAQFCRTARALYKTVSSVNSPQGIIALVKVPVLSLNSMELPCNPLLVCAWGIQDPGNLGTIIRTACAAGASFVCTTSGTVSARNPKAIRSSAGAFFRIPVVGGADPGALLDFCHTNGIRVWVTSPHEGTLYFQSDLRPATAIFLGNEAQGMAEGSISDLPRLKIPMSAGTESLNVAAAGAVLLMEAFKQRSHPCVSQ
jgi:RNA methyltransferase, TrmH family